MTLIFTHLNEIGSSSSSHVYRKSHCGLLVRLVYKNYMDVRSQWPLSKFILEYKWTVEPNLKKFLKGPSQEWGKTLKKEGEKTLLV